jgi:hypothetical protein
MLTIIPQEAPATHPHGEFICSNPDARSLFRYLSKDDYDALVRGKTNNPVHLSCFGETARDILLKESIFGKSGKALIDTFSYSDFVKLPDGSARTSMAIVPRLWVTKNSDVFKSAIEPLSDWRKDTVLDASWNRSSIVIQNYHDIKPYSIEQTMLGSGIVEGVLPEHGINSIVPVAMDTEEGDILIFLANCWHRK